MDKRCSWLADRRETRSLLDRYGLVAKHRMGQNFLVSDAVIRRILDLAELTPEDVVLEVGPGIGTLTVALLPRCAAVVAVEADPALASVLAETCAADSDRLALLLGDALKVLPDGLSAAGDFPHAPDKFVSNLPYQVAATLILRVLEQMSSVRRLVVMVQAEVADRICASPGTKAYGAYTAKLALLGRVSGRFEVAPSCFVPAPHVDSSVVRIDREPLEAPCGEVIASATLAAAARVADAAFAQRRKTIRNSMLASGFGAEVLDTAFAEVGIEATCRAETLEPAAFLALACALEKELPYV